MSVEKFSVIGNKYFAVEVKEGFDKFNLGDTDIKIEMRPRTGVGKYTNFSNHVKIIARTENGKYSIGDHVWVSNKVVDSSFVAGEEFGEHKGEKIYHFPEEGVAFFGDDITTAKSEHWVLAKHKEHSIKEQNGIAIVENEKHNVLTVVNSGDDSIPVGAYIEFIRTKRVEFWQNEKQYWAILRDLVTSVNGEPYGEYYRLDEFDEFEYEVGGIVIKGNKAAQAKYRVEPTRYQRLAQLINPKLPYHNKVAIAYQTKRDAKFSKHIIYLVESGDIVMNFKLHKGLVID